MSALDIQVLLISALRQRREAAVTTTAGTPSLWRGGGWRLVAGGHGRGAGRRKRVGARDKGLCIAYTHAEETCGIHHFAAAVTLRYPLSARWRWQHSVCFSYTAAPWKFEPKRLCSSKRMHRPCAPEHC